MSIRYSAVCERGPAAYSAIVAILIIHVKLLHYFDLLFVVFVFPLMFISLCCVDYVDFLNLDQHVLLFALVALCHFMQLMISHMHHKCS